MPAPTDKIDQTEEELNRCIHDLFLYNEYAEWRKSLSALSVGKWHSLMKSLATSNAPSIALLAFGDEICSNLMFSHIKAPDYAQSQMHMVQFTVSGSMWQCVVWHCPERN
ncbi:hypothetical protein [Pseudomonas syringae]|uniref:Uncharacterized protein n=3 Tax=Pseudomonas syringae TaxID=317 RepID=A0A656JJW4_PSESF|nr:hypothetical protein [Pseudomonas syringae]EPN31519.1 hypothetical protein A245_44750 [Pseudomonas syringae pv. actinidiae ICMP 19096]EPM50392.1 hypothetical protein A246_05494 [Pseudomonas syringae pv. actinidiae ICMP 19098]EPM66529.1 hypothetical protein A249_40452 [Pseudomonas syringae pv. actinidiae ICMP 18804]EPN20613.1 hypothetical protein A248_05815 [Pseudomonas syringae pv. actinidiae ICMP 19100]EPN28291.1 hypothetical protein A247_05751 [Pseudomonas syringae pv. actinidiae ICMP 190